MAFLQASAVPAVDTGCDDGLPSQLGCSGQALLCDGPRGYVDHSPQVGSDLGCAGKVELSSSRSLLQEGVPEDADSTRSTEPPSDLGDADSVSDSEAVSLACTARPLIIFDWDDTLFPTTWIMTNELMTEARSSAQSEELERLALVVHSTLAAASRSNGRMVIVTNADAGWVELSMSHFMPALTPRVSDVEVISARALHEHTGVVCPFEWKRRTFKDICESFYGSDEARNIMCLGDSMHEHVALADVVSDMRNTVTKTVKFAIRPDLDLLMREHERLAVSFDQILSNSRDLRVDL